MVGSGQTMLTCKLFIEMQRATDDLTDWLVKQRHVLVSLKLLYF